MKIGFIDSFFEVFSVITSAVGTWISALFEFNSWTNVLLTISTFASSVAAIASVCVAILALSWRPRLKASDFHFLIKEPTHPDIESKGDYKISNIGTWSAKIFQHDLLVVVVPTGQKLGMRHPSRAKQEAEEAIKDGTHGGPWRKGQQRKNLRKRQQQWFSVSDPRIDGLQNRKPAGTVSYVSFLKETPMTPDEVKKIVAGGLDLYIIGWLEYRAAWLPRRPSYITRFCVKYDKNTDVYNSAGIPEWEASS